MRVLFVLLLTTFMSALFAKEITVSVLNDTDDELFFSLGSLNDEIPSKETRQFSVNDTSFNRPQESQIKIGSENTVSYSVIILDNALFFFAASPSAPSFVIKNYAEKNNLMVTIAAKHDVQGIYRIKVEGAELIIAQQLIENIAREYYPSPQTASRARNSFAPRNNLVPLGQLMCTKDSTKGWLQRLFTVKLFIIILLGGIIVCKVLSHK